jgi:hypothetical protein
MVLGPRPISVVGSAGNIGSSILVSRYTYVLLTNVCLRFAKIPKRAQVKQFSCELTFYVSTTGIWSLIGRCSLTMSPVLRTSMGFESLPASKQQELQTTEAVFSDIIRQLLIQLPELWTPVEKLFEHRSSDASPPTLNEPIEIFEDIESTEHILLAIDALDEA